MAWTTTSDFAVGHVVTAAEWNALAGVSGNTQYLYDAIKTIAQSTTARVAGTEYQNTSGRTMMIAAYLTYNTAAAGTCQSVFFSNSSSPATTGRLLAAIANSGVLNAGLQNTMTVIVLSGHYYKLVNQDGGTGTTSIVAWTEWLIG